MLYFCWTVLFSIPIRMFYPSFACPHSWSEESRRGEIHSFLGLHGIYLGLVGHAQALRNWGANSIRYISENRDQDIFLCYTDIYSRYVSWTTVSSCTWHPPDLFYSWNLYLLTHPPFHPLPTPHPSPFISGNHQSVLWITYLKTVERVDLKCSF